MLQKKDNLVFLVTTVGLGGAEMYLLRFIKYLRKNGFSGNIYVLCKSGKTDGVLLNDFINENVKVIGCYLGYFNFISWVNLYKLLKQRNYKVICDFTGDFAGIPLMIAKQVGILKRVVFYRGSTHHFKVDKLRILYWKIVHCLTMRYATSLLSNSKAAFDFFCKGWQSDVKRKYEVIFNGIPWTAHTDLNVKKLKFTLGIPENKKIIGHVGRFCEAKNHKTIIETAINLCELRDDVIFFLCGPGIPEHLEKIIKSRNLKNKIFLSGGRRDIRNILKLFDLFYFPSMTEGQPNALLEAIIEEVPFVASIIDPIKECIPKQWHNQLVGYDDVSGAVSKILEILDNIENSKKSAKQLSLKSRDLYNPDKCFVKVLKYL